MTIKEKLIQLRKAMITSNIDAFIVYNADPHMSEYLPKQWREVEWISGFTGSAGLVVVTENSAGLWTDSRYFVQAEIELQDSGIELFKQGVDGVPDYVSYLKVQLSENSTIGVNGQCSASDNLRLLRSALANKNITIEDVPLLSTLWTNRPAKNSQPIFIQPLKYAGQSANYKLDAIRKLMTKNNATLHIVSSLDDIAWILNLRGNDVDYNPVFLSYLIVSQEKCILFTDICKCDEKVKKYLTDSSVSLAEYDSFFSYLENIKGVQILLDGHSNQMMFSSLEVDNKIIESLPPSQLLKSIKNSVEIEGMRKAMLKDGVALVQFLYQLHKRVGRDMMTEVSIADDLKKSRSKQENFKGESFSTIAGYQENGAIVHYSAKESHCKEITNKGSLLLDSGGQYIDGTTDITRTIPLGATSEQFKYDYTLVLKGMINLTLAKFPKGTRGCNLDIMARLPLWKEYCNYGHGTGHGVGSFLNVHEGPQSIRQELKEQAILPGMVMSNEPGIYRKGEYGIRHENIILCVEDKTSEFGTFLKFETLTICPFFTDSICKKLLVANEIAWLNNYNNNVFEKLSPMLGNSEKAWLKSVCKAI